MTALLVTAAAIFLWGVVSGRLQRADLTAPIVFVAAGWLVAEAGLVGPQPVTARTLKPLVEITLVWVLFSDAAGVPLSQVRRDLGRYLRLLAVGLPLTVLAGWALADLLFPALGGWLALLVGAALAPTDAALGLPVVTNPAVPVDVRRLITVESGLNDGVVTPVVVLAIAGAASAEGLGGVHGWAALAELGIGVLVGAVSGLAGGGLLRWARRRGWAADDWAGVAVLALAIVAYTASLAVHGNGFVAAFCAGLAFGAAAGPRGPAELVFLEQAGGLVSLLVWLAFGAVAVPMVAGRVQPAVVVYALLSLTVLRMAPVALACAGAGLGRATVLFVGWFGPRGLASLVFALLAVEELGTAAGDAAAVIGLTVLLSVLLHGLSARPLAARYVRAVTGAGDGHDHQG
ncbi:cation:proton antiporter [Nonomuraea roseoviolacea]|uniref:NhaP-type Na+/H+ or K+/H+ antiporter n=1 Tax=Nonomuraea roseoviolacea subsp. carminata TaxID=160689 RepID=A0ABT1K641_9ACTN|nr:cation:proton antiporter [Nonomuraea roseoviolacea]MCP2349469.1 NhaP-type Na+/H+ or K+/H+ antiporter [Nonomuraea roseoviolacea subsp. carminata]